VRLYIDRQFDRKYGVDTSGIIYPSALDISDAQKKTSKEYEPTPVGAIRYILKSLMIEHSQYTFVDFGSGKGRVLLLASEYPYSSVIGVEFSRTLHLIAENNIKIWQRRARIKCRAIQSICMDATEFSLPQAPLVLFFFTPFEAPIARQVVNGIIADFKKNPRPIQIVYYGARQEFLDALAQTNFFRKEIYSRRPLAAIGHYRGYIFTSGIA
jgi:SAM-dependent methyltransferase